MYRLHGAILAYGGEDARATADSVITALSPAAWYRNETGITVTGSGVAVWADHSGNGHDYLQGTDSNRPAYSGGELTFNGTSHYIKTASFSLAQPEWVVLVFKQISWTSGDTIYDGDAGYSMLQAQAGTTPSFRAYAGGGLGTSSLDLGAYGILTNVFDGASSVQQVNNGVTITGNVGAADAGGLTLGALGNGGVPSNIAVVEQVVFDYAPTAQQIAEVVYAYGVNFSIDTSANFYYSEGDSITYSQAPQSYYRLFAANADPVVMGSTFATNGASLADMVARAATTDAVLPSVKYTRKYILSVLIGRNDLVGYTGGATQYAADVASYCAARKAAGWDYIVLCTLLPATTGGFNTERNLVNAIFTGVGWAAANGVDAICDFAADATMGPDAAASDLTYYSDGTHPTLAGQTILETVLRPVVQAL